MTTEIKPEIKPEMTTGTGSEPDKVKRGRGRPRLAPEDRKPKPKDVRRRKATPRDDADNTNKIQCFRCFVWLDKTKFNIKRSGVYYKACKHCTSYMENYRAILRTRASQSKQV